MLFLISRNKKVIDTVASAFSEKYPSQKCISIAADVCILSQQVYSNEWDTNGTILVE